MLRICYSSIIMGYKRERKRGMGTGVGLAKMVSKQVIQEAFPVTESLERRQQHHKEIDCCKISVSYYIVLGNMGLYRNFCVKYIAKGHFLYVK